MSSRDLESLRAALPLVEPYPAGVVPIPHIIPGTAFFPGGDGLWKEEGPVPFPVGGVMVVGHNFDSERGYGISLKKGKENMQGPTWGRTVMLLQAGGIDPRACFFTNFYMGLKAGTKSRGEFPGQLDKEYVRRCQEFFLVQVALLKPAMVITLGLPVPRLIAPLAKELKAWEGLSSIKDLNATPFFNGVKFSAENATCTVAGVIHPCYAERNIQHRSYNGYKEPNVEEVMLKDAFTAMLERMDRPRPVWASTSARPA